jgi:hypothetical protein
VIGAHVGGMPLEEAVGAFGPALLVALSAAATSLRARVRGATPGRRSALEPREGEAAEREVRLPG